MIFYQKSEKFERIEFAIGKIFSKIPLSPNQYTLLPILFVFTSFYFLIKIELLAAFIFYILAAFFDLIDGAVARITGKTTKIGAYLDTILDRYIEAIILTGFLFLTLPTFLLKAEVWIFFSLFGSLMTTYSKAAAKEKGLVKEELKKSFFGRPLRVFLISLSMLLGTFNFTLMIYPIVILAVFSNIFAIQRIYFALSRNLKESEI